MRFSFKNVLANYNSVRRHTHRRFAYLPVVRRCGDRIVIEWLGWFSMTLTWVNEIEDSSLPLFWHGLPIAAPVLA